MRRCGAGFGRGGRWSPAQALSSDRTDDTRQGAIAPTGGGDAGRLPVGAIRAAAPGENRLHAAQRLMKPRASTSRAKLPMPVIAMAVPRAIER